jgi:hypothetical protein
MARLQLRFGSAKSGWLPVVVVVDGVEHVFHASHTPSDFLAGLASALDAFLGAGEGAAVLHEEPRALRWSLKRRGTEADLRIRTHDDFRAAMRNSGEATDLLELSLPARDLALAIWRGFRALEGARETQLKPADWPHPFPSELIAQAGKRLGRRGRGQPSER